MNSAFTKLTQEEILNKGFSVYDYISLEELLMTVRKDYLDILSKINIPFGIISIILGILSYSSGFIGLIVFLLISYAIIFCILFCKLLVKTYYFLLLKNVLITMKGVIVGKEMYAFGENTKLQEKLKYYEQIFLEYLGGKSRLNEYIDSKKKNIIRFSGNGNILSKIQQILKNTFHKGGSDISKIIIPIVLSVGLYIIFMYIFYFLGYFLGYILTKVYAIFIKGVLFFSLNIEYKIKIKTEKIDQNIVKMNHVYTLLDTKFQNFSDGNISDISDFTKKNFDSFYTEIFSVYRDKEQLKKLIEKGNFQDFIDFGIFESYLQKEFNKPVTSMIRLLKKYKELLSNSLGVLQTIVSKDKALSGTIETKEKIIENNLALIEKNISQLKSSRI